jgi:hypothetical protein
VGLQTALGQTLVALSISFEKTLGPANLVFFFQGVKRLICVTGFRAGAGHASISFLQLVPFRLVFGPAYDDKSVQERLLKQLARLDDCAAGSPNQRATDEPVQNPR